MKITKRQLRRIIKEALDAPGWVDQHFAWRNVAFTRDGDLRYINDVASPETVEASEEIGKPVPPGTNVLVVMGANPGSKSVWMHDSELLDLIDREGWYDRPPPKGADPAGFWDGKGEWLEPSTDFDDLPPELPDLPPAELHMESTMRITERQLRSIVRESIPPWMIYQIKKREELAREAEQGRRLPLYPPPPPPPVEEPPIEDLPIDNDRTIIDYSLTTEREERLLRKIIREALELELEIGDVILTGRFKNKRTTVKKFGTDDLGQPTVNGMKLLPFRIEKLLPKEKWSKKSLEALEFAEQVDDKK